jgi:ADP-ribose pyrophosphatase
MIKPGKERVISSSMPFSGKLLNMRVDEVLLPSGRRSLREIVEHRGAVAIVAIWGKKVLLEKQYRHAAGKVMWEIPAGTLEEGEDPRSAAARELEEETGFSPRELEKLSHFFVAVGYSTEVIHLYLATGLEKRSSCQEEDESISTVPLPMETALEMVQRNEIEDAKTIIGLMLAKDRVGER